MLQLNAPTAGTEPATPGRATRPPLRASYRWRLVGLLALTQTAGYGVLFYSFSVFLVPTARTLHTGTATVTGALTASLLTGALIAVPIGRRLDHRGGRALMAGGSLAAALLLLAWSRVESVAELYAVWIGLGLACAAVGYEAAFAVIVSWFGPAERVKAILCVTVVAGFASSIFLPLASALNDAYGWRRAVMLLAIGYGVLAVPLHLFVRRPARTAPTASTASDPDRSTVIRTALRDGVFWVMAASFVAETATVESIAVLLVTMLHSLGHSHTFAAMTAGLVGIVSVAGRLAAAAAGRRRPIGGVAAVSFTIQAVGVALLPVAGRSGSGAVCCVVTIGLGYGVSTIARPAILAHRYGTAAYATLAATWSVPLLLARALAPLGAVLLWHAAGLASALDAAAACSLVGAIGLGLCAGRRAPAVTRNAVAPAAADPGHEPAAHSDTQPAGEYPGSLVQAEPS